MSVKCTFEQTSKIVLLDGRELLIERLTLFKSQNLILEVKPSLRVPFPSFGLSSVQ